MKTRIISAIIALLILVPIFFHGGTIFQIAIWLLSVLGLKEMINAYEKEKELPIFIKVVSYIVISILLLVNHEIDTIRLGLDFKIITGIFLIYLVPAILYHDEEVYSIKDGFMLIGILFFLGISFQLLVFVRSLSLKLVIFLFLISIFTDTFAYTTGLLIGRHKLIKEVSPNKTIEGLIGGTIMGCFISSFYYLTVINPDASISAIIITTLFLSVIGQLGDLVFSAIKRHYKIKDFSNLMPGHGGVLDRFDSILFILLGFMFFINII